MNALILAAGYGSRLASLPAPKPLVPVAGVSMLEWSVRQASCAGITRAVVVTGHRADEIEARLPGISYRTGVRLEACRLSDWSRPNGHSVLAGAARIKGNYLLMMADHLFSAGLLRTLVRDFDRQGGAALAIDRKVEGPTIDPDDATWVRQRANGRIALIGKHLNRYDAVDCGAFIGTPDLAEAIAQAVSEGAAGSLSEGMQRLADCGMADTIDVTGNWWIDVDCPHMHRVAEAQAPHYLTGLPQPVARAVAA
ncbi:phosphocholine cytidylyltransferase family protein [Porphyrobacter sp. LM 6]|uniref:phosphocholine cytidylyltransferase family protein n=1 Tax=Porphyrobacter sp. LM 6 TaxID=1896196 RepID=UPI0008471F86|nr:NTP transferase domain-containing protein [Porphyrobacter sp. LM 6]AOL93446.1 1L-myo-inositol 1-phosphate cytidylyltransferase [Porphyrobacter sp. LM 6]